MEALAVVMDRPESIALSRLDLAAPQAGDVVVDVLWSGISTGTEKLLWTGRMPAFPGMGYPLVPGYESVGEVVEAGPASGCRVGDFVFVPGARCFGPVRSLFGASASRLVVAGARVIPLDRALGDRGILLSLAATAHHALRRTESGALPGLIVGHGVLGRLIARIAVALGGAPLVWEIEPTRMTGGQGYLVARPEDDQRFDYATICEASGAPGIIDQLVPRLSRGGEIVLAGFYDTRLDFGFTPAFMREIRLSIASEFRPDDLAAVRGLIDTGRLSLDGLITHRRAAREAGDAYRTAFADRACLKMTLDWRSLQ
ncbi:MAG: chlorophyll synthesis pathway protein BchC [Thermohalobaculum sp.]|nr:chlorophyll synthesis pathway protein BchC [Thermohalobaculum sp.]